MSDTRALTEDERQAMERAFYKLKHDAIAFNPDGPVFGAGFIAGLRYRDEAEPRKITKAQMEAIARVMRQEAK